jgi:hypothetical protein
MNASWHNDLADLPIMLDDDSAEKYKKAKYKKGLERP